MKQSVLKKYAKVVVNLGINLQKDQEVNIVISADQYLFAEYLTEECYKAGAKKVTVDFTNDKIAKAKQTYESLETMSEVPLWVEEKQKHICKTLPCMIYVESSDPAALEGVDMMKVMKAGQARSKILKKYREERDNKYQWVIVALPSMAWAKRVFPDLKPKEAFKKLEEAIIKCTRIDGKNPVQDWKNHIKNLTEKSKLMNDYNFDRLIYSSENGTNLTLKLNPYHVWLSARETTLLGNDFTANMPTEEVFTMPDINGVDGVVVSTKPLSYNGILIEDFKIYFENGRVTKVEAKKGQDLLEQIVNMDEGSHHLGEVALVPYNSPINETGILFINTLFDENACCHLALGAGFANNMRDYEKYSLEELKQRGLNDSMTHVDFMIGSHDLSIKGITKDNQVIEVFKNGNWNI